MDRGGRGMPILPLIHAGSGHSCLVSSLEQLSLGPCSAARLSPCSSQAPKPPSVPRREEWEMSSDRSLQELHNRKWGKAAAKKHPYKVFIFSVFPG